jgi:DNA-binding beta-propeller fold protein YncE
MSSIRNLAASIALILLSACASHPGARQVTYAVRNNFALGGDGRWDLLAVDPAHHHVFLSRSDRVDVVDADSGKLVGSLPGTDGVHGIAVAASLHRGYSSNGKANSLTEFDLASFKRLRDIPLGGQSPDAIVYDAFSGQVFAFNARSNNVSVVDPASGREVALVGFEGNPELAVVDGHGHLFVNIEDKAQVVEMDTRRRTVINTWSLAGCEGPTGLAMDVAHERLFSACDNQVMVVTDAASGRQVARLAIGEGPDGAAFDAASQDAFSANGQSGTLTVVHELDPEHFRVTQTLATQSGARTVELDPASHRLYLPAARFEAKPAAGEKRPAMLPGSFSLVVVGR